MTQEHRNDTTNEFDAAKTIVETLKGLDKQQQQRAMRFASDTLGLQLPSPSPSSSLITAAPSGSASTIGRNLDIKQFTASKSPKSDMQFAAVVAYYYRFEAPLEQRKETINSKVLADAARLVVRKRPSQFTLNNAKNQGYLDSIGGGEYKISTVGENLVAMTLPGNVGDANSSRGQRRKSKKKSSTKRRRKGSR